MNSNWQKLFLDRTLSRGYAYYREGRIQQYTEDQNHLHGYVVGVHKKAYEVDVELDDEGIHKAFCSCPHAEKGNSCKHIAAILYHYDEQVIPDVKLVRKTNIHWPVEEMIDHLTEEQMRTILKQCVDRPLRLYGWIYAFSKKSMDIEQLILRYFLGFANKMQESKSIREKRDICTDCLSFLQESEEQLITSATLHHNILIEKMLEVSENFKDFPEGYTRIKEYLYEMKTDEDEQYEIS